MNAVKIIIKTQKLKLDMLVFSEILCTRKTVNIIRSRYVIHTYVYVVYVIINTYIFLSLLYFCVL